MNILLIGFMGCGKTSLGKKLAEKMNYNFIDLDKIIEETQKLSISEIFSLKGESYFRNLEREWLSDFDGKDNIISLGGGTPCFHDNMTLINSIGTSVYLQLKPDLLTDRLLNSKQDRPLIDAFKGDRAKLSDEIIKLLERRVDFYKKANIIFDASSMSDNSISRLSEMAYLNSNERL